MGTALTSWLLGLVLGMRHALDPDHLAAVSTLVVEERGPGRGAWLGLMWGLGHAAALFAVGALLALLRVEMPARLADAFELLVAVMLIGLGVRAIRRALLDGNRASARHRPPRLDHAHRAARRQVVGGGSAARRSLVVGIVHGLAGSGAVTVLVLAGLPSTAQRLAYIVVFGAGSVAGMAILSSVASVPLGRLGRGAGAARGLMLTAGTLSTGLGVVWGTPLLARVLG